jgi:hypothetical protein
MSGSAPSRSIAAVARQAAARLSRDVHLLGDERIARVPRAKSWHAARDLGEARARLDLKKPASSAAVPSRLRGSTSSR